MRDEYTKLQRGREAGEINMHRRGPSFEEEPLTLAASYS